MAGAARQPPLPFRQVVAWVNDQPFAGLQTGHYLDLLADLPYRGELIPLASVCWLAWPDYCCGPETSEVPSMAEIDHGVKLHAHNASRQLARVAGVSCHALELAIRCKQIDEFRAALPASSR
jgi:hypothetical protein